MTDRDRDVWERCAEIAQALKSRTDGPVRADWQLGYAAACREIEELIRALDLPLTSTPDEMRDHAAKAAFDAGWPMSNWYDRSQESSATFCIRIVNVALDVVLTSAREVTDRQIAAAALRCSVGMPANVDCDNLARIMLQAALASAPQPACVGDRLQDLIRCLTRDADWLSAWCKAYVAGTHPDPRDPISQIVSDIRGAISSLSPAPSPQAGGVTLHLEPRDDGGWRLSSPTNPNLILSDASMRTVLSRVPDALAALSPRM